MTFLKTNWFKAAVLILFFLFGSCTNNHGTEKENDNKELRIKELEEEADAYYYQTKNYAKAAILYDKLIQEDSSNGEYYYKRAYSLAQQDKPKAAVKNYLKSAKLNYRVFDSYHSLGVIYRLVLLNDSLAIYYYEKAFEENPSSLETKMTLMKMKSNK